MEDYLEKLNPQQREAVAYLDGPELVIAGAGSGKTRVLTYKIVHLLARGFEPWRIMALTFTNKAAREMRERITALTGASTASKLWMGTFHSIFARILRLNAERIGFKPGFTIYDSADSKSLVKSIIKDMGLDDKVYKPATVLGAISSAKNALVSPEDYAMSRDVTEADRRAKRPLTAQIYRAYRDRCLIAGAMDFDDLLYYTNVLLRDNPDVLRHYQEFFQYVLVDEYQDTNFAQHLIVSQLSRNSRMLCVVGDDAQSIYSFRGANIRNILNLKQSYPDLATFKLERNYRSTQCITDAANSLIAKNKFQIPKTVFSENEQGAPIEVVESYSDYDESYLVANRISQVKMRSSDSYEQFAVLYRTNAQSRILEESLRTRNIPYRIYGGLSFYQRKEVKDAIAYFRLSINPYDDEAIRRIINTPARGIGETTLAKITRAAIDSGVALWSVISEPDSYGLAVNSGTKRKLSLFAELINEFAGLNAQGADADTVARTVISRTGLLTSLISDTTPESISKQENIQEILNYVKTFVEEKREEGNPENVNMSDFLAEVSLATDQDTKEDSSAERVTLMTAHAAKGLEFNNIFVVGVEEELFPSAMASNSPQEIEEERRLLYVAITRARKFCMLSYAKSRFRNGQTCITRPSRFISDIDRSHLKMAMGSDITATTWTDSTSPYRQFMPQRMAQPQNSGRTPQVGHHRPPMPPKQPAGAFAIHTASELSAGMRIRHERFGPGVITGIDTANPASGARIQVDFDNGTSKTLLLSYAKFQII